MGEDERVPGSIASLESVVANEGVAHIELVLHSRAHELIDESSADQDDRDPDRGQVAIEVIDLDVDAQDAQGEAARGGVRLLFQVKDVRRPGSSKFGYALSKAFAAAHERQQALPGLGDLEETGVSERAFRISAAMLEGIDVEALGRLRDRIAELMSAPEVPIRALRNPGKVLGELAVTGEVARVTSHGKTVGWLVPATEAEQHIDELLRQGRLRRGTPAPIEPIDIDGMDRPLSEALIEMRDGERS